MKKLTVLMLAMVFSMVSFAQLTPVAGLAAQQVPTKLGGSGTPGVEATLDLTCGTLSVTTVMNDQTSGYVLEIYDASTLANNPTYDNADSMYSLNSENLYTQNFTGATLSLGAGDFVVWIVAVNANNQIDAGQRMEISQETFYTIGTPTYTANADNGSLIDAVVPFQSSDCVTAFGATVDADGSLYSTYYQLSQYGYGLSSIMDYFSQQGLLAATTPTSGTNTYNTTATGLAADAQIVIFYQIVNTNGDNIYDATVITTPILQGGTSEPDVTLTIDNIGVKHCIVSTTLNDQVQKYYLIIAATAVFAENNLNTVGDVYNYCVQNNQYQTAALAGQAITNLDAGEDYTIYCIPANSNGDTANSTAISFTTLDAPETPYLVFDESFTEGEISNAQTQSGSTIQIRDITIGVTPQQGCDQFGVTFFDQGALEEQGYSEAQMLQQLSQWIANIDTGWLNAVPGQTQNVTLAQLTVDSDQTLYGIAIVNEYDKFLYSKNIHVSSWAAGINDVKDNDLTSISVYPNPTNADATLAISGLTENATVVLSDMQGRTIATSKIAAGTTSTTISTESLAAGVYYVRVIAGGNTMTQKVIKR